MKKRAQLSVFIVVGIILILSTGIFLLMRDHGNPEEVLKTVSYEPQELKIYAQTCLDGIVGDLVEEASSRAGLLNWSGRQAPLVFMNDTYYFLCNQQDSRGCVNELVTRGVMEHDLGIEIGRRMKRCINLTPFEQMGFAVEEGSLDASVTIGVDDLLVSLNYPVTLRKGEMTISVDSLKSVYLTKLGYLHDLATYILNSEIRDGFFDQDKWMQAHAGVWIERHKPYPHIAYTLETYDTRINDFLTFRFAVEGVDTAEYIGYPDRIPKADPSGYCIVDGSCYFNTAPAECEGDPVVAGRYEMSPGRCMTPSNVSADGNSSCGPDGCDSCGDHSHGESWCVYDGIVGDGFDMPGSRHYKKSCFDGRIFTEECRDYREEICTENPFIGKAVCRVNRWDDCVFQDNQDDCEDESKRDCYWNKDLAHPDVETYGIKDRKHLCVPMVPPGFKHWKIPENPVCAMASEWRECDGLECPLLWNDRTSQRCSAMGDCGIGRTVTDRLGEGGYYGYNGAPREGVAYLPKGYTKKQGFRLNLPLDETAKSIDASALLYENEDGGKEAIIEALSDFVDRASQWEPCDFCDCVFGTPVGDCVFDEKVVFAEYCNPWQAPKGGDDCKVCNSSPTKLCTEYRCRSLGQRCLYKERDGRGFCDDPDPDDKKGPVLTFSGAQNLSSEQIFDFGGLEGYFICNGDSCSDDMAGSDGIEPYTQINVSISLSEDAVCRATPLPVFEYDEIPMLFADFTQNSYSKDFTYSSLVFPVERVEEMMDEFSSMSSMLQLSELERLNQSINELLDESARLATEYGYDPGQFLKAKEEYENKYMTPLYQFYADFQDSIDDAVFTLSGNAYKVYFKCIDRSGNPQENELFIQYSIGKDMTSPSLLRVIPENDTPQERKFNLSIWLSEPARCRWGLEDAGYSQLPNSFECPSNPVFYHLKKNGFACRTEMDFSSLGTKKVFIRCLDQPRLERHYFINLSRSSVFSEAMDYPFIDLLKEDIINVSDGKRLRGKPPLIYFNQTQLVIDIATRNDVRCRYNVSPEAVSGDGYDDLDKDMLCHGRICHRMIEPEGGGIFHMACIASDAADPNEASFFLRYPVV